MTEVVLGIDVGTSGVRVAACDQSGAVCAMADAPLAAPLTDFGRTLQDPAIWWQALHDAFLQLDLSNLHVLALAIDGTSGTIVPIDAEGRVTALASMYNDVGEAAHVARIKAVAPAETAAHGATSPLARALALQDGCARILHQADWLMGMVSGVFDVSDENNALKTGYDPVMRTWPTWLAAAGMDPAKLPRVLAAGERVGTILPAVAEAWKLPRHVAVVTGTTDGCATFLATGARECGDGVTSLGTTLTLKLLSERPVFAPQYGIYSHRIGRQWLAGGASNVGGAALRAFFSTEEIVRLSAMMDAKVPTGLDYYPLPKPGERFPINDPAMQPRLTPRPADDHVFLQGLFEGLAAVEALGYQRLAELGASPLASIRSAGGGAANEVLTDIRLQRLKVPVLASASAHAAIGTARLAWRGIGYNG